MKHIVFLIAYVYFLYIDLREKQVTFGALVIYAIAALTTLAITRDSVGMEKLIDIIMSLVFGLSIYFMSYFSEEGLGLADGIFFVINGFLLTLKENMILFLTGIMVAFVIGIFLFYFGNSKSRTKARLPFFPCFLPAIIGYIICTV